MLYSTWTDIELLAGTIIGEARGETPLGRLAVGLTIRTRVLHPLNWGNGWRGVILKPDQFDCWWDHNAQVIAATRISQNAMWKSAMMLANSIYNGKAIDSIGEPTNYHAVDCNPEWAEKITFLCKIGKHLFYHDPAIDESHASNR